MKGRISKWQGIEQGFPQGGEQQVFVTSQKSTPNNSIIKNSIPRVGAEKADIYPTSMHGLSVSSQHVTRADTFKT